MPELDGFSACREVRKFSDIPIIMLTAKGDEVCFDDILRNVQERDYIDSHREVAPLRQAEDDLLLDNSELTREEQMQWLLDTFKRVVECQ